MVMVIARVEPDCAICRPGMYLNGRAFASMCKVLVQSLGQKKQGEAHSFFFFFKGSVLTYIPLHAFDLFVHGVQSTISNLVLKITTAPVPQLEKVILYHILLLPLQDSKPFEGNSQAVLAVLQCFIAFALKRNLINTPG